MSELMSINAVGKTQLLLLDIYKLFDVVSLFSHSTYCIILIELSAKKKTCSVYPFVIFVIARSFVFTMVMLSECL